MQENDLTVTARLRREVFRLSDSREKATARIRQLEDTITTLTDVMKRGGGDLAELAEAAEAIAKTSKREWGFVEITTKQIKEAFHRCDLDSMLALHSYEQIARILNEVRQEPRNETQR